MNVYALIVGVEHYDVLKDQLNFELDGPASDAVRFGKILLDRGVPPDHIYMFVSCLERDARRKEMDQATGGSSVDFLSPDQDAIENFFNVELPNLPGGSTLYILWGGHGVMRHGQQRLLFYCNMRKRRPIAFNLDQRLAQLRTFSNLAKQHVFVDACANYLEFSALDRIETTNFELDDPSLLVSQDVLLAAASGQKARNDRVERTGVFSRELFALIEANPQWPSAAELGPLMQQIFQRKGREDRGFRQRPVRLQFAGNDGSEFDSGTPPKAEELMHFAELAKCSIAQLDYLVEFFQRSEVLDDPSHRHEIFEVLFGHDKAERASRLDAESSYATLAAWTLRRKVIGDLVSLLDKKGDDAAGTIETALSRVALACRAVELLDSLDLPVDSYFKVLRRVSTKISDSDDLADAVTKLSTPGSITRNPLYRFLLEIQPMVAPASRGEIDSFLEHSGASPQFIAEVKQDLLRSRQYRLIVSVKNTPLSLVGRLLENGVPQERRASCEFSDRSSFLNALQNIYAELLSDLTGDISIELVLSFDQLCYPTEDVGISLSLPITVAPTPLGHRFPVMLRWRERLLKPAACQGERWLRAANHINRRTSAPNWSARLGRVPDEVDDRFFESLDAPDHDLLDLGFQPEVPADDNLAKSLYYGAAFACWVRSAGERTHDHHNYRSAVLKFLPTGPFVDFPRRAVLMRKIALCSGPIALLWDDPETSPLTYIRTFEEVR